MSETDELHNHLIRLNLPRMAELYETEANRAAQMKLSYSGYLNRLVAEELLAKTDRSIKHRLRKARFPALKTIEGFDFTLQPAVNEMQIKELAELGFLTGAENVLLLGPPGVGKTHLAIGLGVKACLMRKRVNFVSALVLLDELMAAVAIKNLAARLEGINKQFGTYTMMSQATRAIVGGAFAAREVSRVGVVGRKEPVTVYEPMLLEQAAARRPQLEAFAAALAAYYAGEFAEAERLFASIAAEDPPAARYAERCRELLASPPRSWDGVWVMTST